MQIAKCLTVRQQSLWTVLVPKVVFRGLTLPVGMAEEQLADVAKHIMDVR